MLPMLDGDLTKIGVAHMKKMGMEFNLECPVQAVEESPVGAKVSLQEQGRRDRQLRGGEGPGGHRP